MENKILPIQPGTKVRVANGQPMPPARFNRKLKEWKNHNYDAVVVGERAADRFIPVPQYRLQQCGYLSGMVLVFRYAEAEDVAPIEGAERYIVREQGLDAVVIGVAE